MSIQVYICPDEADGTAFTSWLQPCKAGGLGVPTVNSIVAAQIAAKGFKDFWTLASKLVPGDHVWTGTAWVTVSDITILPAPPVPVPVPVPVPSPPTTQTVNLAPGQSVNVNFSGSASITISASN